MELEAKRKRGYQDAAIAAGIVLCVAGAVAVAGTDSTFATATTWLNDKMTGSLGKTFALGSLAVGLGIGIVKQSVMAVAVGVGMAITASIAPGILSGIFTAIL